MGPCASVSLFGKESIVPLPIHEVHPFTDASDLATHSVAGPQGGAAFHAAVIAGMEDLHRREQGYRDAESAGMRGGSQPPASPNQ